jgi:hypothetical protein
MKSSVYLFSFPLPPSNSYIPWYLLFKGEILKQGKNFKTKRKKWHRAECQTAGLIFGSIRSFKLFDFHNCHLHPYLENPCSRAGGVAQVV